VTVVPRAEDALPGPSLLPERRPMAVQSEAARERRARTDDSPARRPFAVVVRLGDISILLDPRAKTRRIRPSFL